MSTPHDALFRAVFSQPEHAGAALRGVLGPRIARRIDWSSLALESGSFVDPELSRVESDVLFRASFSDRPALLYLLFEHQSTVDRWMPLRMLRYVVRIWERALRDDPARRTLPLVIPCVLHHSEGGWWAATRVEALVDVTEEQLESVGDHIPRMTLAMGDVSHVDNDELRARFEGAYVRMVLASLRDSRRLPREVSPAAMRTWIASVQDWLSPLLADRFSREATFLVVRYLHEVLGGGSVVFDAMRDVMGTESESKFRSLADEWRDEGRAEGRAEGRRGLLLKLIHLRFGPPSPALVARVVAGSDGDVDRWAERILTSASLDELLA